MFQNTQLYNDNLKEFIKDEEKFLMQELHNITLMSKAVAPSTSKMRTVARDCEKESMIGDFKDYWN